MGDPALFSKQQLPPNVRIWDSVTLNTLHVIGIGFFDRAVTCIAFSKSVSMSPVGIAAFVHREERISSRLKRERVNTPVTAQVYVQIWTLKPPASQVPHSEVACAPSVTHAPSQTFPR